MIATDLDTRVAGLPHLYWLPMSPWFGDPRLQPGWQVNAYPVSKAMPLDDEAIRDLVYATIDAAPAILPDVDVDISVSAGVVSIKGRVPGKRTKHAIGDAAWWIPSVVDVNNQLEVSPRRERRTAKQGVTRGAA